MQQSFHGQRQSHCRDKKELLERQDQMARSGSDHKMDNFRTLSEFAEALLLRDNSWSRMYVVKMKLCRREIPQSERWMCNSEMAHLLCPVGSDQVYLLVFVI